jgi:putative transposase
MSQNFHALWVHLVWSTKNREPLITREIKWPLYEIIREVCKQKGYYLDHVNGIADHVHLLMEIKPKFAISDIVKDIKGLSWDWARNQQLIEEYFSWQDGFAVFSVSPSQLYKVRQYIRNQEIHHKRISFEDEMKGYGKILDGLF